MFISRTCFHISYPAPFENNNSEAHHSPPRPFDLRSPLIATHTKPLNLTRAEITRRIRELPVSRQQVRLMQKAIAELRPENALLTYMLSIR